MVNQPANQTNKQTMRVRYLNIHLGDGKGCEAQGRPGYTKIVLQIVGLKNNLQRLASGVVFKITCFASVDWCSQVQVLGTDLHTTHQARLWQHPTYKKKKEEDWQRCQLRVNLPHQNKKKWEREFPLNYSLFN